MHHRQLDLQSLARETWELRLHTNIYPEPPAFLSENAAVALSCTNRPRRLTLRSLTSTSIASSAWRRLIPCFARLAKIRLRKDLANLSNFRLMVDSWTCRARAISAKVRESRKYEASTNLSS